MFTYRIFCCGETGETSIAGGLETMLALKPGHKHTIKGREWYCDWVGKNIDGKPLANFRLSQSIIILI